MLNCVLADYIHFITEIASIEKLKLSFSHDIYSNSIDLKDIKNYCMVKYGKLRKSKKIIFRT